MAEMAVENPRGRFARNTHGVVKVLPESQAAEYLVGKPRHYRLIHQRTEVRYRIRFIIHEAFTHNAARHALRQRKDFTIEPALSQFEPVNRVLQDCEWEVTHVNES